MSDKLRQFVEENREAFDTETPGPRLLKKLQKQLEENVPSGRIYMLRPLQWAAVLACFVMLSVAIFFTFQNRSGRGSLPVTTVENIEEKTGISDATYAKQISQYQELIGMQQTELREVSNTDPALYLRFAGDISHLDSAYRLLRATLANNPNTELLLEAMIQNLQLQTDLLNRQLIIIKEIKQKGKAHEKITS